MKLEDFARHFPDKLARLNDFVNGSDIKDLAGVEAVNHFQSSFDNEGFTDDVLQPWAEVKRRQAGSPWYGHSGQLGRYSDERTRAPILSGETRELRNAIRYVHTPYGVRILNEKPYAAVHNQGGLAYVYGKVPFNVTARTFIAPSKMLMSTISDKIKRVITTIIAT